MSEHEVNQNNANSLAALVWAIRASQGKFSLILARCNSTTVRSQIVQQLRDSSPVEWREVVLDQSVKRLFATLKAQLGDEQPSALMVFGLEALPNLGSVLTAANQVREEFRKQFSFPIVWWVTDDVLRQLMQLAPDLESWTKTIRFSSSPEQLIQLIQQTADQIFSQVLETGAGKFLSNVALNLGKGSPLRAELKSAYQELQHQGITFTPELEASWQFILGRIADGVSDESQQHYEQSLALWQHCLPGDLDDPESEKQTTVSPDVSSRNQYINQRLGCVLYSLGIGWRTYAVRHRAEYEMACDRAKGYFQQCVAVFEQCQQPELVTKFINAVGEILQRLKQWDELAALAEKALELHQTHSEPFRLARVYGFLAEVALAKSDWSEAQTLAQNALTLVQSYLESSSDSPSTGDVDWVRFYDQGWYHFALARAQRGLGQNAEAIDQLETARKQTQPHYEPELYIQILQALRDTYFQHGQYLKAFEIKQKQREIEQRYGFRAFIGAGRLQPKQEAISSSLLPGETKETITQEIAASGRQQDVQRLLERLGRIDHKLTVIYGQSGVGKSSIVQAGLIPVLQGEAIGIRDILPVLLQVYTDWRQELGQCLAESLKAVKAIRLTEPLDTTAVIEELNKNADRNLLTVLIFDQFEEFFFIYKDTQQRLPFYEFLRDCLDIPYVKVILSLREDYLHYLLEFNRLTMLEVINNNILDKLIIYYLGNFSPADTKSVIQSLTAQSQFFLEEALIDELVSDLAGHLGEVRPIELQVVGSQLQTEKITTLKQYREKGPKEVLVGRFLEEVVKDCGSENEQIAKLVLYLLTDENNTRPLKTRADLELELDVKLETLTLVLDVLVKSGLVLRVPASPADRYQLVHDYLVPFVRQQQSARLVAELEKEREQRKLTEAKLNQVLKQQLRAARRATLTLAGLLAVIGGVALTATVVGINLYLTNLTSVSTQKEELDRVVSALKAGKMLKQPLLSMATIPGTRLRVLAELNQALNGVTESNRLEGHEGTVTHISFSPKGDIIATASEDKTVRLWNLDGSSIGILKGHTNAVNSTMFSPNGKRLASVSQDGMVKLWDINGNLIKDWNAHQDGVTTVAFSPNGKLLATAGGDKTVKIWNRDGKPKAIIEIGDVTTLRFIPDSTILAMGSQYDTVKFWNINGKLIGEIDNYGAMSMQFNSDKSTIDIVNKDGSTKQWHINIFNGINENFLVKSTNSCDTEKISNISVNYYSNLAAYSLDNIYYKDRVVLAKKDSIGCYYIEELNHNDAITSLSLSPNGKLLASASQDNTIKIWRFEKTSNGSNTENSRTIKLAHSRNGIAVAKGRADNTVQLWQKNSNSPKIIQADSSILSFSPTGQTLATASADDIVTIWAIEGQKMRLPKSIFNIKYIEISPDSQRIATVSGNNTVQIWNREGILIQTLSGHRANIESVKFSPNGKVIATIEANDVVQLWHRDGKPIITLPGRSVIFSPDGQFVASLGEDNLIHIWRQNSKVIKTLIGHTDRVTSVKFSPNGKIIASVSDGGNRPANSEIKLWHSYNGSEIKTIANYGIGSLIFSPNGNIFASINADNTVKLWNIKGDLLGTIKGHNASIYDLKFSRNGEKIATASEDNTVRLWNGKNGSQIKTLRGHSDVVYSVSFSPDSEIIASASKDKTVKIWNSSYGTNINTLTVPSDEGNTDGLLFHRVSFSNNGKMITSVSGTRSWSSKKVKSKYTVRFWRRDGEHIKTLFGQSDNSLIKLDNGIIDLNLISFSEDSETVALARQEHNINLWDINRNLQSTLKGHSSWINSISFSDDGKKIASASDDKTVKLWNLDGDASSPQTIGKHEGKVNSVSFSKDGNTIASASDDKTVKIWNIDGSIFKDIDQHNEQMTSVRFSPNGKTLAYANENGAVRLWRSSTDKSIDLLKPDDSISNIDALNFSKDGKMLALGGSQMGKAQLYILNGMWLKLTELYNMTEFSDVSFSPSPQSITVSGNDGMLVLSPSLDELLEQGCDWARDYLKNNSKVPESDRTLCDGIGTPE